MWIVKLGGSLWDAPVLRDWLDAAARAPRPVTIVPGGGPFADAVRAAQPVMGFDDRAAHRMAILAMQQYAEALASLAPRLPLVAEPSCERACIWSPWPMAAEAPDLRPSWEITSDSIAAWLAARVAAEMLVLVKSAPPPEGATLARLARDGIVDQGLRGPLRLLRRDRPEMLVDATCGWVS